ncbi:hypothetical protein [Pseudalkalibacillus caeni]|uniref:Uncharacterized protein n=1 Tax=Exobacillus caeni TaxID=2574798 RepID=A0A5R9F3C2_9BACL|nr:hypothetical protein [Pseudalkalibacillus caeni]TLS36836.1 hypothetical protein FCL54_12830 [Pseudalkalibacillus caeni]
MAYLKGTLLFTAILLILLTGVTAFDQNRDDDLEYTAGEIDAKIVRYEKPVMEVSGNAKEEEKANDDIKTDENEKDNPEETKTDQIDSEMKPYYYLIIDNTPFLTDFETWKAYEEGNEVMVGYEKKNVHILKTIEQN